MATIESSPASEHGSGRAPPTLSRTPNLAALLVGLRRRWLLAALLGLIPAALAAYATWEYVPVAKYMVRAMVHISAVQESLLPSNAQDTETRFSYFQRTQMTLVKSQIVLDAVLADPNVAALVTIQENPAPREWLNEQLEVDFTQGPEILRITLRGNRAEDLVVIVNSVMQCYLDEFVNTEARRRSSRRTQLDKMLSDHQSELNRRRVRVSQFLEVLGGVPKGERSGQDVHFELLSRAHERLAKVQGEIEQLELQLSDLQSRAKAPRESLASPALIADELAKDAAVQHWQTTIAALRARETEYRSRLAPGFAEERIKSERIREGLASAQKESDEHVKKVRPALVERLARDALVALDLQLEQRQRELELARSRRETATEEVQRLSRDLRDVGKTVLDLNLATKEVEDEERLVGSIVQELRGLDLQAMAPPRARQLDKAIVTGLSTGRKRPMFAAGAFCGVLGLVCLAIAWLEFSRRKVDTVDEVVYGFGVELVGTLPNLTRKRASWARDTLVSGASRRWTAAIDSYRMLLMRSLGPESTTLMVTSASAGEGKTSLSSHLAVSVARSGRRTLLIDADLRKPTLHRLFGVPVSPGLTDVLCGATSPEDSVRATGVPNLWLLPAGDRVQSQYDPLTEDRTRDLLEQMRTSFETTIVDSSPVLLVADSLTLVQHVDGILLSIMRGVSQMPKISAALHRIKCLGRPVLGAVVHGTEEEVYGTEYLVSHTDEA